MSIGSKEEYESFMVFEINNLGELKRLNITQEQFRENNGRNVLDSAKVLIIVEEDLQRIYIWKGMNSHIRNRFISNRVAQKLQEELRKDGRYLPCKIVSVDEATYKDDEDGDFSLPYIFKPPTPPGDLAITGELQFRQPIPEEELEAKPYCKHCGSILPEGQSICHVCGKKVK